MPESIEFWFTLVVLIGMTTVLIKEWVDTALAVFGTLLLLLISGVISTDDAFRGFSNHGMLAVGFLYIVAAAVHSTGLMNNIAHSMLGRTHRSVPRVLMRLLPPVAATSAFMNNTPIVAMLVPMIKNWCVKMNLSPSKFMLPLSYAAILGGTCTLIGTSTNLVIHGFLLETGHPGFGFFDFAWIGIPLSVIGISVILLITHRVLPNHKDTMIQLGEHTREFVVALKVTPEYPHIGKTVEDAGLRHLQGLFLFQIERNGNTITPVQPDRTIREGDRLFFTGIPSTIVELQKEPGLQVMEELEFDLKNYDSNQVKPYEIVMSERSPLIGQTVRESDFRRQYGAVILAIHRNGERIARKVGDIRLQPGDTLLILSDEEFHNRWYHSSDFLLVSSSDETPSRSWWQSFSIIAILVMIIGSVVTGMLDMVTAAAAGTLILLVTGLIKGQYALQSVDWRVLLVIASSFGIAAGLENAGIAELAGSALAMLAEPAGLWGAIALVMLISIIYSEMITNNAAAVIIFPIMISIATASNYDIFPLAMAVAIGASAAFATPISYQTNLMVYGPGQYRFTDYLKAGVPLDIIILLSGSTLIYLFFG